MEILVLTISDRASKGIYKDKSGPAVEAVLKKYLQSITVSRAIVPDERRAILGAFKKNLHCDFIITTGGTGLSARDITPETTASFCDRLIPGISEILRIESWKQTPHAMLSRGVAGQKGKTLIINLPGSVSGAGFCAKLLIPVIQHGAEMVRGEGH